MKSWALALDVVREAAARRWVLTLLAAVTLALIAVGLGLQVQLVDGALAATRLFGNQLSGHSSAEVLRPFFEGAAYLTYYLGLPFGILAVADLAPRLLAPGRVEHLLSLPLHRWEILLGTLVGVLVLASGAALYGALGLTALLWLKTGYFNPGPLAAGLLAAVSFAALYAAMLASAVFVRSAAAAAALGFVLFCLGVASSFRQKLEPFFAPGGPRLAFDALLLPMPRVGNLAEAAAAVAGGVPVEAGRLAALLAGTLAFGIACYLLAVGRFTRKDY